MWTRITFILVTAILALTPDLARSDEIVILDSENQVRAQESITSRARVEFALSNEAGDPAQGFEVYLINLENQETLTQNAEGGRAVFEEVTPGHWQVSSSVDWVHFDSILIVSDQKKGLATWLERGAKARALLPPILILGAAAGPMVAIADSGGDSHPLSPSS